MDKLTIEEKAKRYDEAIEKGKQIQNTPYTAHWDTMKEVVEHLLPELKESEDERIRKALMQNLKERFGTKGNMGKGLNMPDVLAWLEKQGEQKPAEWSEEDKMQLDAAIHLVSSTGHIETANWLKSLRPQNAWKPSDEQMEALDIAIRCGIQLGTWEEEALKSLKEKLFKLKKLREE